MRLVGQRRIEAAAHGQCRDLYLDMRQRYMNQLQLEKDKADHSFRSRRALLQTIGLPAVRGHRLRLLAREEEQSAADLKRRGQVVPQLTPLIMLHIS